MMKGLPFSGKTEWARRWVSEDPTHRLRLSWTETMGMMGRANRHHRLIAFEGCVHMALQALARGMSVVIDEENLASLEWAPFTARVAQVKGRVEWHNMRASSDYCMIRAITILGREKSDKVLDDIEHKGEVFRQWLKK